MNRYMVWALWFSLCAPPAILYIQFGSVKVALILSFGLQDICGSRLEEWIESKGMDNVAKMVSNFYDAKSKRLQDSWSAIQAKAKWPEEPKGTDQYPKIRKAWDTKCEAADKYKTEQLEKDEDKFKEENEDIIGSLEKDMIGCEYGCGSMDRIGNPEGGSKECIGYCDAKIYKDGNIRKITRCDKEIMRNSGNAYFKCS